MDGLPELVTELERRWSVSVVESLEGGTAAYVARARTADDRPVVIKVGVPDPDVNDEIDTLRRARGQGYVQLLAFDVERRAMLLEALGPSLVQSALPPERQLEILGRLAAQAWAVAPPIGDVAVPVDKAADLARLVPRLWDDLNSPCAERTVAQALECAERRAAAFDPDRCVTVHGDAAAANALEVLSPRRGAETGYVFVDPDGFLGDPAYDLGVALRDWCPQLLSSDDPLGLTHRYAGLLAAESGIGARVVWEWGFLERVSTGLYAIALGAHELGRPLLDTADLLS